MTRNLALLLVAQFITAFADNAVLFSALALLLATQDLPSWYVPTLQGCFLVSFVLLAPWVGNLADNRPKATILTGANVVKAMGAGLLLAGIEPLLSYAVVGVGAALYSPAKYGILPELSPPGKLVTMNGYVEGSTILAILTGSLVGATIADNSVETALTLVIGCYAVSATLALFITRISPKSAEHVRALPHFSHMVRTLFKIPRARFAVLGVTLFWAAAATLRVMLVAWAPAVLMLTSTASIAELTIYCAIGVAIGSVAAPRFIPLGHLRRARLAAYAMGVSIVLLAFADGIWAARVALLAAGFSGGMFVVPMNAALQEIGHRTLGAGGAVAVQHFFENVGMLTAMGIYAFAAGQGAGPTAAMLSLGVIVLIATGIVSRHLPENGEVLVSAPAKRTGGGK